MLKKIACLLAVCLLLCLFGGCSYTSDVVTLNVFNWGEYIDDEILDVNALFTEETGIRINYKTYESNESMYTLLQSGAAEYDVVIPSDYMIGKMIREGMLAKLNFDNIPNYQYIDEAYRHLAYDPLNEYSVPYTWGTVGIFYNKKYVDEADLEQGWDILWNEKYKGKIYMFDNARDSFGIALKKLGYSMNTEDPSHWQQAYDALAAQKPLVQGYFMDQVFQKMTNEEGWLAPYYSGDGANMITGEDGNEDIGFLVGCEGCSFLKQCAYLVKFFLIFVAVPYGLERTVLIAADHCVKAELVRIVECIPLFHCHVLRVVLTAERFFTITIDERLVVIEMVPCTIVDECIVLCIAVRKSLDLSLVSESLLPEQSVHDFSSLAEESHDLLVIVREGVVKR